MKRQTLLLSVIVVLILTGLAGEGEITRSYASTIKQEPFPQYVFVFAENSQRYCAVANADGSNLTILYQGDDWFYADAPPICRSGLLSPDGSMWLHVLPVESGGWGYWPPATLEVQTTADNHRVVELLPDIWVGLVWGQDLNRLQWMPDNNHVLFWYQEWGADTGFANSNSGDLILFDVDSGEGEILTRFDEHDPNLMFVHEVSPDGEPTLGLSPTGDSVLYRSGEPGKMVLYSFSLDDLETHALVETGSVDSCVKWSPDGEQIVFQYRPPTLATVGVNSANARSGPGTTYGVVNTFAQGTQLEVVDRTSEWVKVIDESGQEAWVSTSVVSLTGGMTIEVVNADGTGQRTLAQGSTPAWSPDGERIAFVCEAENAICLVPPDGTDLQHIVTYTGEGVGPLHWSPDSQKLAYITGQPYRDSAGQIDGYVHTLHVFDIVQGRDHTLVSGRIEFGIGCGGGNVQIEWSPDSQWLIYEPILPDDFVLYVCSFEECSPINSQNGDEAEVGMARWYPER